MDKRVWIIAGWEFRRYFKWKGELVSLLIITLLALASFGGSGLISRLLSDDPAQVAVVGAQPGSLAEDPAGMLLFSYHSEADETDLMQQLLDEELDGILYMEGAATRVVVKEDADWLETLQGYFDRRAQGERLARLNLTESDLAAILAPAAVQVDFHPQGNPPSSKGERVFVVVVLVLMMIGILNSFGLFFVSITSEKQQRITEQVISAVSAQAWIDGKLVGISAMSIKAMFTAGLTAFLSLLLYSQLSDQPLLIAGISGRPLTLFNIILFGFAGLLFWNCFLAAVAATVSDPNTSTRTPIMFLPILAVAVGFAGLSQPDSLGMQILSWFPLTSMGVMPMRLGLGNVAWWE
ncbi:MAG TPA: ABC transporter permease, partial [Xanthomonadales bacterium]|nr:ABC transporter permease [Xanthomonadales bacterium]